MVNKEIGKKLSALRKQAGYTQKDVAEYITNELSLERAMSYKTVSSWETGLAEPDALTFLKLCNLYGVADIMEEFTGEAATPVESPKLSPDALAVARAYAALDEQGKAMIRGALGLELDYEEKRVLYIKKLAGQVAAASGDASNIGEAQKLYDNAKGGEHEG